jgi:hypothetical protein
VVTDFRHPNLPPTQPHIQRIPGVHYPVAKRRGLGGRFTMKLMKLKLQGPSDAGGIPKSLEGTLVMP